MKKNLVSVIVPVYNGETTVEDTINSVMNQTYEDWELILIDDGSSDRSIEKMKEIMKLDNRIKLYINERNMGVSETRNRGIGESKGEWLAFLDSDDSWDKNKLELQIEVVKKLNAEFVFTGAKFINEAGKPYAGILEVPQTLNYKKLKYHNIISCSSVLVNKRFFDNIKMENDNMSEDYAVWLRILKTGVVAHGINKPLLTYRLSKNSKSGNKLKTFGMAYKVYRFIGIHPLPSIYYTLSHLLYSLSKYKKIYLSK